MSAGQQKMRQSGTVKEGFLDEQKEAERLEETSGLVEGEKSEVEEPVAPSHWWCFHHLFLPGELDQRQEEWHLRISRNS